jgi:hypothetical protein
MWGCEARSTIGMLRSDKIVTEAQGTCATSSIPSSRLKEKI